MQSPFIRDGHGSIYYFWILIGIIDGGREKGASQKMDRIQKALTRRE